MSYSDSPGSRCQTCGETLVFDGSLHHCRPDGGRTAFEDLNRAAMLRNVMESAAYKAVVAERDALQARVAELTDELADVRESERAFKSDRDDALDRARHHQRRRIEAVKRAQAAERAARRGGTLRAAVSPRADAADMYRVPGWAVRAYDRDGGEGQVPR